MLEEKKKKRISDSGLCLKALRVSELGLSN
jgi:hypothetical protein